MGRRHAEEMPTEAEVEAFTTPLTTEQANGSATEPAPARTPKMYTKREAVLAILKILDRVEGGPATQDAVLAAVVELR